MSTATRHLLPPTGAPASWRGPQIDWTESCLFHLDEADIDEIGRALAALNARGGERTLPLRRQDFPLDRVARKLAAVAEQIYRGKGFAMLRGLPRTEDSADEMAQIYFGLSVHLGVPISQSHRGELLGHVLNLEGYGEVARAYQDGGHMNMHTDSCDIIGLMCLRTAKAGGASRICSALAIHDALAESRPDLLASLYGGYYFRRGDKDAQLGDGRKVSLAPVPVFDRLDGWPQRVACYFLGSYIRRAAQEGHGHLTDLDREAIATLETMAESPDFYLDMQFQDGDIQFLNNRVIVHGRTDYVDEYAIEKRRHLLRVWLSAPEWPPLAERQVMHSDEDHRLWLARRQPELEFPEAYLESLRASVA